MQIAKKVLAILSAMLMVFGTFAVGGAGFALTASAEGTDKAIRLVKNGALDSIRGAQQSNLWFGNYRQSSDGTGGWNVDPIKWRVLENKDGKLFLLADKALDKVRFNESLSFDTWDTCTLRKWLNGYDGHPYDDTFIGTAFSDEEAAMIAETTVVNGKHPVYSGISSGRDTTDKVFLLSLQEVLKTDYGFLNNYENTDTRVALASEYTHDGGHTGAAGGMGSGSFRIYWWLRTRSQFLDHTGVVLNNGSIALTGDHVDEVGIAVRPAFNLNPDSVLFTSAADGKQGDGLTAIPDYTGADWKLTLLDENRFFAVSSSLLTAAPGETVTIDYTGAAVGENEYVSAILTDDNGDALYYGRLAQPSDANGTAQVAIPADLADGTYTLKVFSEQSKL